MKVNRNEKRNLGAFLFLLVALSLGIYLFLSKPPQRNSIHHESTLVSKSSKENSSSSLTDRQTQKDNTTSEQETKKVAPTDVIIEHQPVNQEDILEDYRRYPEVLITEFESLKRKADNGDINSAFILGDTLQKCYFEPRTQEQYNRALTKDPSISMDVLNFGFNLCKGVIDDQLKLSTHYLELAALEGDIEAQIGYFAAMPHEINGYDDDYTPTTEEEKAYLATVYQKKINFIETARNNGNINSAILLGLAYSDDTSKTVTGYNLERALENLFLAKQMDPEDRNSVGAYIEHLRVKTPVHIFERAQINSQKNFSELFDHKTVFTYLETSTDEQD